MSVKKRTGNNHFDIAFLGDSLAALIAAAILTKRGCRVISIHNQRATPAKWLTSSALLEKILDLLDGRACCTTPVPFQVITRNQRVDINGKNPLNDELRREFPAEHQVISTFLDDMQALGDQLQELLWEHQGIPTGKIGNRLRFRKNCFSADIPGRIFRKTLRERLADFTEPGARKFLTALFSGYAFAPSNKLTLAESALIWSSLVRLGGVTKSGLEELLWHRFRQFHGEEYEQHRLARVRFGKDGTAKFLFDDDTVATADRLIFADRETIHLCEGVSPPPSARTSRSHFSGNIKDRISPLLCRHVIVDGNPPLRLYLEASEAASVCHVENAVISDQGLVSIEQIEQRLSRVLPFVDLALTPDGNQADNDISLRAEGKSILLHAHEKIAFDHGRLSLCSGMAVMPELGATGEVLVAMTVANQILRETGKQPL